MRNGRVRRLIPRLSLLPGVPPQGSTRKPATQNPGSGAGIGDEAGSAHGD
jgi:hypothetical protein